MAKFKKSDKVNFKRAGIDKKNTSIIAVVEPPKGMDGNPIPVIVPYIIEHEKGWLPNALRIKQFGLDPKKKYLFVKEEELTEV